MLILFNALFNDSNGPVLKEKLLIEKLDINGFTDKSNNWDNFFWVLIILAIIKRFTVTLFKIL
jgi:hypothetical protein